MRYLLALLVLLSATTVTASALPKTTDVMVIQGVITGSSMQPLNQKLADYLTDKDATPYYLDIIISSPGGSVGAGFFFLDKLNALKQRGTVIRCYVGEMAASMAFQILLTCNERHSLDTSFLLWHRARVVLGGFAGQVMTGPQLYSLGVQLKQLDEHIYRDVTAALQAPDHYLRFHFENETLHTGAGLAKAVPNFINNDVDADWLMSVLLGSGGTRTAAGAFDKFRPGDLVYIWDRFLPAGI